MAFPGGSVGVLRALMILVGGLGVIGNAPGLLAGETPLRVKLLTMPAFALGVAFLYFGFTLRTQLRKRPSAVVMLCIAAMVIQAGYTLSEIVWSVTHDQVPIPISAVKLLIAWFLYALTKRLVREQAGAVAPAEVEGSNPSIRA